MQPRKRAKIDTRSEEHQSKQITQHRKPGSKESRFNLSFICRVLKVSIILQLSILIVLLFAPGPIHPLAFQLPSPTLLDNSISRVELSGERAQKVLPIWGPESMVAISDQLYTGTYDGKVLKLNTKSLSIVELPRIGAGPCGTIDLEPTCGRPLGMRLHKGYLYVMDAYLGLFKFDIMNFTMSPTKLFGDVVFGNDLVITSSGMIYYTDSSRRWSRRDFMMLILESSLDGQLVEYNEKTRQKRILASDLSFANDVELSPSEDFLIVCETNRARLARYWLHGPNKGTWDYLNNNLPGFPDNVRLSPRGTFWVGLAIGRTATDPLIIDRLAQRPFLRSALAKVIKYVLPGLYKQLVTPKGLAVELDMDGRVLRLLHDTKGETVINISEVEETDDGDFYFGSYFAPYLIKVENIS